MQKVWGNNSGKFRILSGMRRKSGHNDDNRGNEKNGNGSAGKTVGKILKGAAGAAVTMMGSVVVPIVSEEVGKGMQKAVKKGTSKFLKATGLKKKTPFDMAGKAIKTMKKKVGK